MISGSGGGYRQVGELARAERAALQYDEPDVRAFRTGGRWPNTSWR